MRWDSACRISPDTTGIFTCIYLQTIEHEEYIHTYIPISVRIRMPIVVCKYMYMYINT